MADKITKLKECLKDNGIDPDEVDTVAQAIGFILLDEDIDQSVILDADHAGHLLVMLAEYHTFVLDQWHCGELENDDVANTCYLLGNIESRVRYNHLTQDDLDLLEYWEEELNEQKEGNNGQILEPR